MSTFPDRKSLMQQQVVNEVAKELSPTPTRLSAASRPEACLLISAPSSHKTEATRLGPCHHWTVSSQPLLVEGDSQHLPYPLMRSLFDL